jgi:predicted ATP-grasp superfamily ATP-dependent carboligase
MKSPSVLVLDGEQRASLAVTRSLGRRGVIVAAGSEISPSLAGSSRYAKYGFRYESPSRNPGKFIADIMDAMDKYSAGMIMPITDLAMYHVLKSSAQLGNVILPFAPFEKYLEASDKMSLLRLAAELGVPIPQTIFVEEPADIKKYIFGLDYPLILKPRASLIQSEGRLIRTVVKIARSEQDLMTIIRDNESFSIPFMIQETVKGEGKGIFTLFDNGKPTAVFAHRRIREKPPWGGVSAVSESIEPDPFVKDCAFRLLEKMNWHGPAMVEFKMDDNHGLPVLMEVNARFWGSLQLAVDAGVDFPWLLYQMGIGVKFDPVMTYEKSRLRWLMGDIDNLYITLKTPAERLPVESRNKPATAFNFIKEFFGPAKSDVLEMDDLKPFLWELRHYLKDLIS